MSDKKYPWGNQAPAARLKGLETKLAKSEGARDKLIEDHKKKLATHDEGLREIRGDIRQVSNFIEKAEAEARAARLSSLLTGLLDGEDADALDQAMKDGTLQEKLKSATKAAVSEAEGKPKAAPKEEKPKAKA